MPVDIQNSLAHMKGQVISIDGRAYQLDAEGIVREMPDADAQQLLQNKGTPWHVLIERKPVIAAKVASPVPPAKVAEVKPVVEVKPVEPPKPVPEPEPIVKGDTKKEIKLTEEKIPVAGEEWPDPTTKMSLPYLKKMADAYKIKYKGDVLKPNLVKKILAAMYE
jgi:hypothetical protein